MGLQRLMSSAVVALLALCIAMSGLATAVKAKPGLLLNMLTRDEAENLDRTLPHWAKIIDAWVIGIDVKNTDNSEEIIEKHLGHIPGKIVVVEFDGMGPAWTKLVKVGIEKFPEVSHGIISDADFQPHTNVFKGSEFDVEVSKYMYKIVSDGDDSTERKMDWIYRNIPGAEVQRRVHQVVYSPPLEGFNKPYMLESTLVVEEAEGGYQDRSGKKVDNYIYYLNKDLDDFPNDARTLYYLGFSYLEKYLILRKADDPEAMSFLKKSVSVYERRADIPLADENEVPSGPVSKHREGVGNFEERYFAILKLGEIYERYMNSWDKAMRWYERAIEEDELRAEPWFYIGQHYRLANQGQRALKYLRKALSLQIPDRSLFVWADLYNCIVPLEFARTIDEMSEPEKEDVRLGKRALMKANSKCEGVEKSEAKKLLEGVDELFQRDKMTGPVAFDRFNKPLNKLLNWCTDNLDEFETALGERDETIFTTLLEYLSDLQDIVDKGRRVSCRDYRLATTPFLKWSKTVADDIAEALPDHAAKFTDRLKAIRSPCRYS
eukprot:GFYU01026746.1.p1 GENE.GFYU01026746.1~~GFYU01026746.1.p1  ORF type:complete len:548 (+),score=142.89 GFYU01026746.1:146-1789(+)